MAHRIRETCNIQQEKLKGTIEMNETFIGGKESNKHENKRLKQGRGTVGKVAVMGAISREKKQAVAYPVSSVNHDTVTSFRNNHIDANSDIIAANVLHMINHTQLRVNHSKKQYVDVIIHTNSIESFWATIKRAYIGTFHYWSKKHLHRYINEFAKKANIGNDFMEYVCKNANNKKLMYKELIR